MEVKNRKKSNKNEKTFVAKVIREQDTTKLSKFEESYKETLKTQRNHRVIARLVFILCVLIVAYFWKTNEKPFATLKDHFPLRVQQLECNTNTVHSCSKKCGRLVSDNLVPLNDAKIIKEFTLKYFNQTPKIKGLYLIHVITYIFQLLLVLGAVNIVSISNGTHFKQSFDIANKAYIVFRLMVVNLIHLIEERFEANKEFLSLSHPIFISQITNNTPSVLDKNYFLDNVDQEQFPYSHYTAILFLSDFKKDFTGGRFIFNDQNKTKSIVEPKIGRVIIYSTGAENTNYIEYIQSGTRYAMTIPLTCDRKHGLHTMSEFGI